MKWMGTEAMRNQPKTEKHGSEQANINSDDVTSDAFAE
jgi:hypothetical protein